MPKIIVTTGRPFGHVPGHSYYDVTVTSRGCIRVADATSRAPTRTTRSDPIAAIERVTATALGEHDDVEHRRYILAAAAKAIAAVADAGESAVAS